jgi:hypothetical protein
MESQNKSPNSKGFDFYALLRKPEVPKPYDVCTITVSCMWTEPPKFWSNQYKWDCTLKKCRMDRERDEHRCETFQLTPFFATKKELCLRLLFEQLEKDKLSVSKVNKSRWINLHCIFAIFFPFDETQIFLLCWIIQQLCFSHFFFPLID